MHTHLSKESFTCKECDYKTFSKYSLSRHYLEYGHNASYECKDCDSMFCFANALAKHAHLVHNIPYQGIIQNMVTMQVMNVKTVTQSFALQMP